ncbi:4-diphosphocytidyl-2C-methyl-D-erythritol kinase [Clostridia bacterium]|nr:4-diphosphocytidyl-2C-methyl-D-erythritol kinase [Clostridia bacterium]
MKQAYTDSAYAKINTYLDITGETADGNHTLLTVMRKTDLCDTVSMSAEGDFYNADTVFVNITTDSDDIPLGSSNIVFKMTERFFDIRGKAVSAEKRRSRTADEKNGTRNAYLSYDIKKRIPVGGGLGGSSADGASALRLLQLAFGDESAAETAGLAKIAGEVSADATFLFGSGNAAVCAGRGDITVPPAPGGVAKSGESVDLHLVIVQPDFTQDTAEAYRAYDADKTRIEQIAEVAKVRAKASEAVAAAHTCEVCEDCGNCEITERAAALASLAEITAASGVSDTLFNIFEYVGDNAPRIAEIKQTLLDAGATAAGLSGSGSCVYGVFATPELAEAASHKLDYPFVTVARTL